jgi:hypothetical protein
VVGDVLHVMIISNLIENAWPEIIFDQWTPDGFTCRIPFGFKNRFTII